jgi:hypothetical protein
MENQHRKIQSYRELTQEDIDTMNRIKAMERDCLCLLEQIGELPEVDQRRLNIAKTNIEQAAMWATKAVARPEYQS